MKKLSVRARLAIILASAIAAWALALTPLIIWVSL